MPDESARAASAFLAELPEQVSERELFVTASAAATAYARRWPKRVYRLDPDTVGAFCDDVNVAPYLRNLSPHKRLFEAERLLTRQWEYLFAGEQSGKIQRLRIRLLLRDKPLRPFEQALLTAIFDLAAEDGPNVLASYRKLAMLAAIHYQGEIMSPRTVGRALDTLEIRYPEITVRRGIPWVVGQRRTRVATVVMLDLTGITLRHTVDGKIIPS
jgi:hypothetical protein